MRVFISQLGLMALLALSFTLGGVAMSAPDYRTLALRGDGMKQDSASLALVAAARLLGRQADYERVHALTGNAFSPMLDLGEDCTAWWHNEAWMGANNLPAAAAALGLRAERRALAPLGIEQPTDDDFRRYRMQVAPGIRAVMNQGGVVLALGWWLYVPQRVFTAWGWAGIITEVQGDGAILGACLNGHTDNPLHHPEYLWAVYPADGPALAPREADLAILRAGIARWRGTGSYDTGKTLAYGRKAMDAWIVHMRTVPNFCTPCGKKGWTCARDNGWTMEGGARTAAACLRRMVPDAPASARSHLEVAAQHYDRVVALLQPAITGNGGETYEQFIGDLQRQQAHADTVLTPMVDELEAATAEMAKAVQEYEQPDAVAGSAPAADRRVIENVPLLQWGKQDCTYAGALAAALSVTEHPVAYEEIMGFSGLAFRVRWWANPGEPGRRSWCPSTAVGEFPEEVAATQARTGWRLDGRARMERESDPHMEDFAADIKASIDRGMPVLAYPTTRMLDMGTIYGYQDGGKTWLVRDYHAKDGTTLVPIERLGPMIILPSWEGPASPRRETMLAALRMGIAHWNRKREPNKNDNYLYGQAALEAWATDLGSVDRPGGFTDAERESLRFLNWWNAAQWYDARRAAVVFVQAAAAEIGGEPGVALGRAADEYRAVTKLLADAFEAKDAFIAPWASKSLAAWTPQVRTHEQALLRQAMEHEALAAAALEEAVARAEGRKVVVLPAAAKTFQAVQREFDDLNHIRTNLTTRLAVMRTAGATTATYDDLVMLAGFGTSFGYHPKKFWYMYQSPDQPDEAEDRLVRGTGFGWRWLPKEHDPVRLWETIAGELDAGRPVQAEWMDDFLIAGYQDAPRPEERRLFVLGKWAPPHWEAWQDLTAWAKDFGRLGVHTGEQTVPVDQTVEVLHGIVRHATADQRGTVDGAKDGAFGFAGIEAYAADVANADMDPDAFNPAWLNCHGINRQVSGRQCAANWLARNAAHFPEPMAGHLRAAAEAYTAAFQAWGDFRTALLGAETPEMKEVKTRWRDPARRTAAAGAIRRALAHERRAVAEVASALERLPVEAR